MFIRGIGIRRSVLVPLALAFAVVSLVAVASPVSASNPPGAAASMSAARSASVPAAGVTAAAWSCAPGFFCAWDGLNGTGNPCRWDLADRDWRATPVVCSWAGTANVQSALDNGNDSSFLAVQVFTSANYQNTFACLRRGVPYNITAGGIKLRSHMWVNFYC